MFLSMLILYYLVFFFQDLSKSPKSVKKLLPKRKPERKQSEEEFASRKSMFKIFPIIYVKTKIQYVIFSCFTLNIEVIV